MPTESGQGGTGAGNPFGPFGNSGKQKKANPMAVLGITIAAVVVVAYGVYFWKTVSNPGVNDGNVNALASPSASPLAVSSPTPAASPTTKAERLTIGSVSLMVPAGVVVRDNAALAQLFSNAGVGLIASRSIGVGSFDDIAAKVQKNEITLPEALKTYWRFDILELGNPEQQALTEWVGTHWPPYEGVDNLEVSKSTRKIDGLDVTVHTLKHLDLGMYQTIHFIQPKVKGNVVILSTFQGVDRPFEKVLESLLTSAKF